MFFPILHFRVSNLCGRGAGSLVVRGRVVWEEKQQQQLQEEKKNTFIYVQRFWINNEQTRGVDDDHKICTRQAWNKIIVTVCSHFPCSFQGNMFRLIAKEVIQEPE